MIDLVIILIFVAYSVSAGFRHQKKASRSLEDYFLAGREVKGWKAGISMAATQFAADTPLLVTGLIATAGLFSLWRLWVYALAFLLMGFILGPAWRSARILTDAELTEVRYGSKAALLIRGLKAVHMGLVMNCTVLAMVLFAAVHVAEPFLIWHEWLPQAPVQALASFLEKIQFGMSTQDISHPDYWLLSASNLISILVIVLFTLLYSTTGGLRSVIATDLVQFAIAMTATFLYAIILLNHVGGLGALTTKLQTAYGAQTTKLLSLGPPDLSLVTWFFIGVLSVQWFAQVNSDGTGYLAQRTMACSTDAEAKKASVIFTFTQILLRSLLWIPIGLCLLILYPAEGLFQQTESFRLAREATFGTGIRDFLPVGIRGLMLTGMLAALASTIDTHLNWGSSYLTHDLYARIGSEKILKRKPSAKETVWVARCSNILILCLALWVMSRLTSIQAAWHLSLLFGSGLGIVLILRWIWWRVNLASEIAAAGASLIFAPILLFAFPEMPEAARLLWMVLLSTIIMLAATLLTRPEPMDKLTTFYERVRPIGFWRPIAKRVTAPGGDPQNAFYKNAFAVALAAVSLFTLLIGCVGWMTGTYSAGVIVLLLGTGLVLVPVWWGLAVNSG